MPLRATCASPSDRARFGWPQARRGISSISGPAMLSAKIPLNMALEFLYTGNYIDAASAHRLNLINRVVPPEELDDAAEGLVGEIRVNVPLAMRSMKRVAVEGQSLDLEGRVRLAGQAFLENLKTADSAEGLRAFAEKRPPVFTTVTITWKVADTYERRGRLYQVMDTRIVNARRETVLTRRTTNIFMGVEISGIS